MRKCRLGLGVIVLILFFHCCVEENVIDDRGNIVEGFGITDEEKILLAQVAKPKRTISVSEARYEAEELAGLLDLNGQQLKTGQKRTIESMKVVSKSNMKTKSAIDGEEVLPDTLAYIFNYAEENGFTLIAADQRIKEPVLAYSTSGNMNNEYIDNPGLAVFLENAAEYIFDQIKQAEHIRDSLLQVFSERYKASYVIETKAIIDEPVLLPEPGDNIRTYELAVGNWEVIGNVGPLLPVEWGQGEPFNDLVKNRLSCGTVPTGCVATAVAQIMAYWKYPQSINNITLDWNVLNDYSGQYYNRANRYKNWVDKMDNAADHIKYQVAHLMRMIGENSGMKYECKSSGAKTYKGRDYLRSVGYQGGEESKWNFDAVLSSLDARRPILMRGDRTFKYINVLGQKIGWTENGHAWVVDGYLKRRQKMQIVVEYWPRPQELRPGELPKKELPIIETSYYYRYSRLAHMNWGWGGNYNGYFAEGCFDSRSQNVPSNMKSEESDYYDNSEDGGSEGEYKYNNKIYINIHK